MRQEQISAAHAEQNLCKTRTAFLVRTQKDWKENLDGSGNSWTEHTVEGDFHGAYSVYSADVNGDGYMDVLGAADNADDITLVGSECVSP